MISQKEVINSGSWDILIILDACRYDFFNMLYGSVFDVQKARSEGSCTQEWFYKTFKGKYFDAIYLSGNGFIHDRLVENKALGYRFRASDHFFKVVKVWDYGWRKVFDSYTVSAFAIYTSFNFYYSRFKNKKFVIHFIQPHAPYVKSFGLAKYFKNTMKSPDCGLWNALRRREVPHETVVKAYIENLKYVMKYVFKIVNRFKGKRKIIITSDHGECFGEKGHFNHPCNVNIEELRAVPLVVI